METLNDLIFRNYKSWIKFQIRAQNVYSLIVHRRGRKNEMSSHPSTCNSQWTKTKISLQKLLGKTNSNVYRRNSPWINSRWAKQVTERPKNWLLKIKIPLNVLLKIGNLFSRLPKGQLISKGLIGVFKSTKNQRIF